MNFLLIVKPEAEEELLDAATWYENKRNGLGSDFLLSIEATLESIKRNPNQFLFRYKNIQRALVKRFPYVVYFMVEDNTVIVFAIIHERRDPNYHHVRIENP